jgi:hypothetical protein
MKGFVLLLALTSLSALPSRAGVFEVSGSYSFYRTNYSPMDYTWKRRWGVSLGYYFFETSELEIAYQDVFDKTYVSAYQDTEFLDQVYSLNWVQGILGKDYFAQPYVKFGVGQLNRTASGTYSNGSSPPAIYDALTIVLAVGIKTYITKRFGIKGEVTTYLAGGNINTWQDNLAFTIGTSFYF